MDIKARIKVRNKFEIIVKDVRTGGIVKRAYAENVVLNRYYEYMTANNSRSFFSMIAFGSGIGTPSISDTSLFTFVGAKTATDIEMVTNLPPTPSYRKRKIVLSPSEYIGVTITEVGVVFGVTNTDVGTHAMLKDSVGNTITIGPKTDTQEITIYATVYAEIILPDGVKLIISSGRNELVAMLLGTAPVDRLSASSCKLYISSSKEETDQSKDYRTILPISNTIFGFNTFNSSEKYSQAKYRIGTTVGNGRIWSLVWENTYPSRIFRILFPNELWSGYHFENKSVGIGNGTTKTFILPWSDINATKQYDFYIDGVKAVKDVDYTLSNTANETSVTFGTAPITSKPITGDWWVDYIPKDTNHVLDITFKVTFGEGV